MIALLGLMVFSLWFLGSLGIQVLADSQAYNSAAATWSAAEHEASYHLTQYAATRNAKDYAEFLQALEKPEAARLAFAELSTPDPIQSVARGSLLESGIDPGDVGFILRTSAILRRLNFWPELAQQREGVGVEIKRLQDLAAVLHSQIVARDPSQARLDYVLTQIHNVRHRISDQEAAFADDIALAAGRLKNMILTTLLVTALSVSLLGALLTRALLQRAHGSASTTPAQDAEDDLAAKAI